MTTKTKNTKTHRINLAQASQQAGILMMTAAVTLGLMELPEHPGAKVVLPNQPSFVFATHNNQDNQNNPLRREREETGPHYISYTVAQRTPGRHGRA